MLFLGLNFMKKTLHSLTAVAYLLLLKELKKQPYDKTMHHLR